MENLTANNPRRCSWSLKAKLALLTLLILTACDQTPAPTANSATKTVTLLFTNDFESAYDPVTAYWRNDMQRIGGIAQLATLVDQQRATEPNPFLLDAGDIFTGTLAKLSKGELAFELMLSMGYDAMVIGNHEFEYGWQELAAQKSRAPFPVLGANLFYKDTNHPYAQPYTVLERNGIRIGVIGILGQDAATALIPANIAGVDVRPPAPIVQHYIDQLSDNVDITVLLTHMGMTAPMQTNDEASPEVYRGIEADLQLAGALNGLDVLLGGHADAGTPKAVVHPQTGTLIMQTFGQGQHLGFLQLELSDPSNGKPTITAHSSKLIPVNSDALSPHPIVEAKLNRYRNQHPEIYTVVGQTDTDLTRRYYQESDLGNLFADILRDATNTPIGLMPSGALRKDIAAGPIRTVDLLDAFPFEDRMAVVELTGNQLLDVLEQGLSLQRGMLQVSGLNITYDPAATSHQRLRSVHIQGEPIVLGNRYRVGTVEILAAGGDAFTPFKAGSLISLSEQQFGAALSAYVLAKPLLKRPQAKRITPSTSP